MSIVAGIAVVLAGFVGVVLTLVGFSGAWLAIVAALVADWLVEERLFGWWVMGIAIGCAALGEAAEFVAGSIGATKAGGTKRAAIGAMVGGLLGAILGTPFFPVVGTIVGAAVGAGVGAAVMDLTREQRRLGEVWRVGQGAAVGRLVATVVKTALAGVVAVMLGVAAFV